MLVNKKNILLRQRNNMIRSTMGWFLTDWMTLKGQGYHYWDAFTGLNIPCHTVWRIKKTMILCWKEYKSNIYHQRNRETLTKGVCLSRDEASHSLQKVIYVQNTLWARTQQAEIHQFIDVGVVEWESLTYPWIPNGDCISIKQCAILISWGWRMLHWKNA